MISGSSYQEQIATQRYHGDQVDEQSAGKIDEILLGRLDEAITSRLIKSDDPTFSKALPHLREYQRKECQKSCRSNKQNMKRQMQIYK